jgi:hypothetical protein
MHFAHGDMTLGVNGWIFLRALISSKSVLDIYILKDISKILYGKFILATEKMEDLETILSSLFLHPVLEAKSDFPLKQWNRVPIENLVKKFKSPMNTQDAVIPLHEHAN